MLQVTLDEMRSLFFFLKTWLKGRQLNLITNTFFFLKTRLDKRQHNLIADTFFFFRTWIKGRQLNLIVDIGHASKGDNTLLQLIYFFLFRIWLKGRLNLISDTFFFLSRDNPLIIADTCTCIFYALYNIQNFQM